MESDSFTDPYIDPETGVLRNLVGALDQGALAVAEADLVFPRVLAISGYAVKPSGDLDELRDIHRFLFQALFDWAGELRTVDIRKPEGGSEFFLPVAMIERAAAFAAAELESDDLLKGLDRPRFIKRLAYHYDQINYIHPFREGNGRTQRVFFNRIAQDAGWRLNWIEVQGEVNDEACRVAAEDRDLTLLETMFDRITTRLPHP